MLRSKLLASVFLLLIVSANANAQLQDLPLPTPTPLVLEVLFYKNAAPTYLALSRRDGRPAVAWFGGFGRIQNWQLPAGQLPIRAVNIVARLDGEVARISVSLFRGVRFHDQETMVGSYQLRETETISVKELGLFGVEPFHLSVKRIAPAVPNQPIVKSLAKSLEIVGIEPLTSTLPQYKLTLRNVSGKNIRALWIIILSDGVESMSVQPEGEEGLPLIKAGAFFESNQPLDTRAVQTPGGFTPETTISQETLITSVVFEDGSYEGDPAWAARSRAFGSGRKLALTRLLEICAAMEEVLSSGQERAAQVAIFRDRVRATSVEVDEAVLAQLVGNFPTLDRKETTTDLKSAVESGMIHLRKGLLDDLAVFEKNQPSDFRSWLVKVEERYPTWLSRL